MTIGQKSEKAKTVDTDSEQMSLFNEAEQEQSTSEREEEKSIVVNTALSIMHKLSNALTAENTPKNPTTKSPLS